MLKLPYECGKNLVERRAPQVFLITSIRIFHLVYRYGGVILELQLVWLHCKLLLYTHSYTSYNLSEIFPTRDSVGKLAHTVTKFVTSVMY